MLVGAALYYTTQHNRTGTTLITLVVTITVTITITICAEQGSDNWKECVYLALLPQVEDPYSHGELQHVQTGVRGTVHWENVSNELRKG